MAPTRGNALRLELLLVVTMVAPLSAQERGVAPLRWGQVGGAVGLILFAGIFDAPVARFAERPASESRLTLARRLDHFGEIQVSVPVVGGLLLAGELAQRPRLTALAKQTTTALLLTGMTVILAKHVGGRARPYEDPERGGLSFTPFSGQNAFPSGHTAAAFTLAGSLADAIPSRMARVGLYTAAAGTAWARIAQERHWLSDVVAGAAVGLLSARVASGRISVLGLPAPRLRLGSTGAGLAWSLPLPTP